MQSYDNIKLPLFYDILQPPSMHEEEEKRLAWKKERYQQEKMDAQFFEGKVTVFNKCLNEIKTVSELLEENNQLKQDVNSLKKENQKLSKITKVSKSLPKPRKFIKSYFSAGNFDKLQEIRYSFPFYSPPSSTSLEEEQNTTKKIISAKENFKLDNLKDVLPQLGVFLKNNPDNFEARLLMAYYNLYNKDLEQAEKNFQLAFKCAEGNVFIEGFNVNSKNKKLGEGYLGLALLALNREKYLQAKEFSLSATENLENYPLPYVFLALIYFMAGEITEANDMFDLACLIELSLTHLKTLFQMLSYNSLNFRKKLETLKNLNENAPLSRFEKELKNFTL